ncbi:MAG: flagellar biosynthesis anti-sigma factor FlgM [Thermodesulfobacteriota bacterium]|nr:flagellar biosynthesis anti-sigma factor FlgM [Thermodesulfobacteriota bacterium]
MKLTDVISQIQTDNKISSKKKSPGVNGTTPSSPAGRDRVELSSGSRDVRKIQEILQETPDIRLDKIQELKEKIEKGEYHVDSLQLADKMLMSLLSEESPVDK